MAKTVDFDLLNARMREQEGLVQNARYLEQLSLEGKSPEEVVEGVKNFLELEEGETVLQNATDKVKKYNFETKAFLELVNFRSKANFTGLIDEEESKYLEAIEARVAEKISNRFGIEVDELYTEAE